MALPSLAEVGDLASWVGQSIDSEDPRAKAVLSAASALVRAHTGETWVDDTQALTEVPDMVAVVVVQVAARVWLNPAGLTSVTVDDATRRWGESGTVGLYLTEAEKATLADYSATGLPDDLGTISVTRGTLPANSVYVPTAPGPSGPPFPWYAADDLS